MMENIIQRDAEEDFLLESHQSKQSGPSRIINVRYTLAVLTMVGVFCAYLMKACLSVVILRITPGHGISTDHSMIFQWSSFTQGFVLGSFYFGYAISQIPGSFAAYKYGSKKLFGFAIFCISVCNILTPFIMVRFGAYGIIILRIFQGMADGFTFPTLLCFWSKWSPESERSLLVSISMTGMYTGTFIAMSVTDYIIKLNGWKMVFYICGSFGILWCVLWTFLSSECPEDHPFIARTEKDYIVQSRHMNLTSDMLKIPWKFMFKSVPFLALSVGLFCQDWGTFILMAIQPTYVNKGLNYSLSESGIYSGIPYVFQPLIMTLGGSVADLCHRRNYMSLTNIRKSTVVIAFLGQFLFLVASLQFTSSNIRLILLNVSSVFSGLTYSGLMPNIIDINPEYSGATMSVSNTFSAFSGIFSVIIAGKIISSQSIEEWNLVFYVTASFYVIGIFSFGTFSSANVQSWNSL
ncbi:Sialin [Nymphon striatum]|nr:Sialin [Nymphon striatum]